MTPFIQTNRHFKIKTLSFVPCSSAGEFRVETMVMDEESKKNPNDSKSVNTNPMFSPGFRSVAEMAGWDEEALLNAVVQDTPDRILEHLKRSGILNLTTPPTNSRRKRLAQMRSPISATVLNLDEAECEKVETESECGRGKNEVNEAEAKDSSDHPAHPSLSLPVSSLTEASAAIPCMEKLREELSCAICLEICYEPSTTPCGHSFCKKCLRSAAEKCGKKCPKCRHQLLSNSRGCTVNTVLWNTIKLLFPQEVEARKAAALEGIRRVSGKQTPVMDMINSPPDPEQQQLGGSLERINSHGARRRNARPSGDFVRILRSRRELPSQDEDAAMALRLQREEFMGAFCRDSQVVQASNSNGSEERHRNSIAVVRANLRAMASRAVSIRSASRRWT
ncbi:unnamed protein product [Cuscuta epithymum]|uniref:RING-type E3 ubiquitin transferase n=1 Tax=Cuscuta epithymum TaxID=186058 RepID=A0AAV0CIE7_9ASTE|nr:unnamed protein product [Cuscuta epithymum]